MRVLITGINGFVGKILNEKLVEKGHEVYGVDLQGNGENIFSLDITDPERVTECTGDIAPDFIYHLAAISRVDVNNPGSIFNVNINGTLNLLSAGIMLERMPRFVFISSSQVYGNVDRSLQPIGEDIPVAPVNLYGASKAAGENIARAFHVEFGLPLVILRPFNHTGHGQTENFFIPKLAGAFKREQNEIPVGNVDVYRDFLDVRDVVRAYQKVMEHFPDGGIFNISSGRSIPLSEVISLLREFSGHDPVLVYRNDLRRKNEIFYSQGDSSKIRQRLNWEPRYTIVDTIRWMLGM